MPKPKTDIQLKTIEQNLNPLTNQAYELTVNSDTSLKEASTILVDAKKKLKLLTTDMKALIDPLKASIKAIQAKYATPQEALESIIDVLTKKVTDYQTFITNARLEAESAITERIKPGKGNFSLEKGLEKLEALDPVEKKIETDTGGMTFISHPMCEVEDITQVPIKFYLVDMVAIRADMKAGIRHPGIRYWTEQRPKNLRS